MPLEERPYQVMDPLSPVELEQLREDIRVNGVRMPIDVDENGMILDGHHRADVAAELGVECPRRVLAGLTEEQKVDHAFAVNSTRRHHDQDRRRATVQRSLLRDPHLSDRRHARRTGVSHPTVAAIRARLVEAGQLERVTSREGGDGRVRTVATRDVESFTTRRGEIPHVEPLTEADGTVLCECEDVIEQALKMLDETILYALSNKVDPALIMGWLTTAKYRAGKHFATDEAVAAVLTAMFDTRIEHLLRRGKAIAAELAGPDICRVPLTEDEMVELATAISGGAL